MTAANSAVCSFVAEAHSYRVLCIIHGQEAFVCVSSYEERIRALEAELAKEREFNPLRKAVYDRDTETIAELKARVRELEGENAKMNTALSHFRNPGFEWIQSDSCDHEKRICRHWRLLIDVSEACNHLSWLEESERRLIAKLQEAPR